MPNQVRRTINCRHKIFKCPSLILPPVFPVPCDWLFLYVFSAFQEDRPTSFQLCICRGNRASFSSLPVKLTHSSWSNLILNSISAFELEAFKPRRPKFQSVQTVWYSVLNKKWQSTKKQCHPSLLRFLRVQIFSPVSNLPTNKPSRWAHIHHLLLLRPGHSTWEVHYLSFGYLQIPPHSSKPHLYPISCRRISQIP